MRAVGDDFAGAQGVRFYFLLVEAAVGDGEDAIVAQHVGWSAKSRGPHGNTGVV